MTIAFTVLAALTIGSALSMVRSRNIVHAGYWLLPCFVGIAGLFAALDAHFFFVVQLLVYAGAILVLILFAVMLTRHAAHPVGRRTNRLVIPAALASLATAGAVSWILAQHTWAITGRAAGSPAEQTEMLGKALIEMYGLPFEVASLVLVAALVGAVVVARSDSVEEVAEVAVIEEVIGAEEPLVGVEA